MTIKELPKKSKKARRKIPVKKRIKKESPLPISKIIPVCNIKNGVWDSELNKWRSLTAEDFIYIAEFPDGRDMLGLGDKTVDNPTTTDTPVDRPQECSMAGGAGNCYCPVNSIAIGNDAVVHVGTTQEQDIENELSRIVKSFEKEIQEKGYGAYNINLKKLMILPAAKAALGKYNTIFNRYNLSVYERAKITNEGLVRLGLMTDEERIENNDYDELKDKERRNQEREKKYAIIEEITKLRNRQSFFERIKAKLKEWFI